MKGKYCAGIIGGRSYASSSSMSGDLTIIDCYNIGILSGGTSNHAIIYNAGNKTVTITTCYYLEGLGTSQTGATALNEAMMQEQNSIALWLVYSLLHS
jgi:hypothetical protein